MQFDSPYGVVVLTQERRRHILTFHPDVIGFLQHCARVLAHPEIVVRSEHDPSVLICYGFIARKKKYLAVVIKTGKSPFVLTAYLAKQPKRGTLET